MQIKVPRNTIFEQLPRSVRRQLIGEKVPEHFTFEVDSFEVGSFPSEANIREEFPAAYKNFTPTEWYMFCCLCSFEGEVSNNILAAKIKNDGANPNNGVAVHMKNVRAKVSKFQIPVEIHTVRGGNVSVGGFILERL